MRRWRWGRTAIEMLHVAIGLGATAGIVAVSSWAYPLARWEIEVTGIACAIVVLLLGIRPVRRAWREDREFARRQGTPHD